MKEKNQPSEKLIAEKLMDFALDLYFLPLPSAFIEDLETNSYLQSQLKIGIKIELEHTPFEKIATRIALHHIYEFSNYYEKLIPMEQELELEKEKHQKKITIAKAIISK